MKYSRFGTGRTRFLAFGEPDQQPLIFLPGYNLLPEAYADLARAIVRQKGLIAGQVIIPDFHKPRLPGTLEEYLERSETFLREFFAEDERPYCLGGHSFGGALALLTTERQEYKPERLLLINPAVPQDSSPSELVLRAIEGHVDEQLHTRSRRGRVAGSVAASKYALRIMFNLKPWLSGLEAIAKLPAPDTQSGVPILALLSGRDGIFSYDETTRSLLEELGTPGSHAVVLPDTRHNLPLRYPTLCAEAIADSLEHATSDLTRRVA